MKIASVLIVIAVLSICSCTKKSDVQCTCHANTQTYFYDFGIQKNPSFSTYAAKCDTLGTHNNIDTCNLIIL